MADTGIKNPGSVSTVAYGGSILSWSNLVNALTLNSSYANANISYGYSNYLYTYNYSLGVPSGATITGLVLSVTRYGTSGVTVSDKSVKLYYNGSVIGADRALAGAWVSTPATIDYGSTVDLWGYALTPAIVNHSSFGALFSVQSTSACFVKGTKISTPYGEKNIEDIQEYDEVLAFDESGKIWVRNVLGKTFSIAKKTIVITTESYEGQCTEEHPFFTSTGWVKARDLQVGDLVYVKDGSNLVLETIESKVEEEGEFETYDLNITDDLDTFIANGFAVHNKPQYSGNIDVMQITVYYTLGGSAVLRNQAILLNQAILKTQ